MKVGIVYSQVSPRLLSTRPTKEFLDWEIQVYGIVCRTNRSGVQMTFPCTGDPQHNELNYHAGDWPLFEHTIKAIQNLGSVVAVGEYFAPSDNVGLQHLGLPEWHGSYRTVAHEISEASCYLPRTQGAGGFYGAKLLLIDPREFEREYGVELPLSVPPEVDSPIHSLVSMRHLDTEYLPSSAHAFCCSFGDENRFTVCLGGERDLIGNVWREVREAHHDLEWHEVDSAPDELLRFDYQGGLPAQISAIFA